MMTTEETWSQKIGKPAADSLREMVAALECDYDRLEELRSDRDGHEIDPDANEAADGPGYANPQEAWDAENPDEAAELKELEAAAAGTDANYPCKDRDDAERRIQEDALSVEVRSGWVTPGDDMTAEEFTILLTTGGPAVRIIGELDEHGEPHRCWLEVQDWGKPWTEYYESGLADVCLTYARCFCFAS